ncbi:MAG: flavin reductase family protein [Erysipelotrichaceae bacterium]|nr:flavin reductase family protein [Erysipelotrichaceae bacterium]
MSRQYWRGSNLLNPVPAVMVSCADEEGNANVMTAAWAGTVCSDPVMVSVSIRKERYSHAIIERTGEFVVNLTNKKLAKVTDFVGVRSGRDVDKFNLEGDLKITKEPSKIVKAPCIAESPLCLECKVRQIIRLGSHDMFIGEVVSTNVDESLLDENGRLDLERADLIAYSHGEYYSLGKKVGKFGYSVQKKKPVDKKKAVKKTVPKKKTRNKNSK